MSYIEENLLPNETIVQSTRVHWMIFMPGFLCLVFTMFLATQGMRTVTLTMLALSAIIFLKCFVVARTTEFAATTSRLIVKTGWLNRNTEEMRYDKMEEVRLNQSMQGRLMGFGTLEVDGTGGGRITLRNIDDPQEFRKAVMMAIEHRELRRY